MFGKNRWTIIIKIFMSAIQSIWSGCRNSTVADIVNSLSGCAGRYCEMPLKILKAEQLVGGEEEMDAILAKLFTRELDPTYPYLTYQDFLSACALTEEDLDLA